MDEFLIELQAKLDEAKSKGNINSDILNKLQGKVNELKLQAVIDDKSISNLVKQLEGVLNQKINISNININQSQLSNSAKQTGQQIGNNIAQGINQGVNQSTSTMKSFSQLMDSMKSQKILFTNDGLIDEKQTLNEIKQIYSEFGQVKITNKVFDSGELQSFKVNIEQVNGDLKETRTFMMQLSDNGKFFVFPDDVVKGTEKYVQHLNEAKNITNATGDALNAQKQKLAEQEKYYDKLEQASKEQFAIEKQRITAGEKQLEILDAQSKRRDSRISYNEGQIDKKGLSDITKQREINDLVYAESEKLDAAFAKELDKNLSNLSKLKLKWQEQGIYVDEFKEKVESLETSLNNIDSGDVKGLNGIRQQMESLKTEALQIAEANKIQLSIDNGTYDAKYDDLIAKTEQWSFQYDKLTASVKELESAYKGFDDANTDEEKIAAAKRWEQAVKSVNNAIKQTKLKYATDDKIAKFHQQVQETYDKNSAMHKDWGKDLLQMINATSSGAEVLNKDFDKMYAKFLNIKNAARQANKLGKSWFDTIRSNVQSYLPWVSMAGVIGEATQQVRKMYKAVYDIDTAMTELAKVSDTTSQRLTQSLEKSTKTAEKYGATINEVISATADWSRLGYDIDSAEKLAEVATIYKNVGDGIDINTANESLVSTLQGFGKTADEALHIIDVFNEVANNYAIGSDGIGEALQRSASSMNAAGNTLEETVALITAANTVVQDPSSVGNAYKTISMRIRGAKTELEEMGEDTEGMTESTAKLQKEILALSGVDIMKDKNTFKSTYQILDELSSKWSKLTDIQRASITELIAGKRQGNIISALMENFDVARDSLETALNSEGSAMKEQETYLSSLEAKTKQFEAAFQSLSSTVLDSNLIKFFVDLGTTGVSSLEGLFKILNSINSLGGLTNGSFGGLGAISGLLMNRAGIGERTMFRW